MHKFTCVAKGTRSIIDYIIINERLKINVEDTRVFRGRKINTDHKLVESKFKFTINSKQIYNVRDQKIHKNPA